MRTDYTYIDGFDTAKSQKRVGKQWKDLATEDTGSLGLTKPIAEISASINRFLDPTTGHEYGAEADIFQFLTGKIYENRNKLALVVFSASAALPLAGGTMTGAINFNNQNMTNVDIDSGTIDGATIATSDITIGADKTLELREAGTFNTSAAQNLAIVQGAGANVDIGTFSLTANTLVSDVADGTAPLVVTSTTRVANLQSSTVGSIAGHAPNTATTQATQAAITTAANLTTVGALNAGSITSGFTSIDVGSGAISSTTFVGTKHILYNGAFYVNDNPFIQNSLYFGGNLGHQQSNWNDPQAIGGDPMTVSTFNIGDDDQNWGHILPFDVSKIEILCGLRPGGTHTDQFSLVLYTAPRTKNASSITLTRVAENGVNFLSGGKYQDNDLTHTADIDAGTMIYVGVGTNTSSPAAKNARGYMSITITQR